MKRTRLMRRRRTVGLSQEALAEQLGVDVSSVRRWEYGQRLPQPWQRPNLATALKISVEQLAILLGDADDAPETEQREVMAALFADAWGTPTPQEVLQSPPSSDPQVRAAERTLKELGILVRCDMLTRRETLTQVVKAVSGPALLASIADWLTDRPDGLEARDQGAQGTQRIGESDVEALERSTRFFAATDAEIGGALSREAAVGQLKYAVDLAKYASYSNATGNRLLAVIAELSGLVGYICHDSGMPGPAQRYFRYSLEAARESTDPRAPLLVIGILADMGEHARWLNRPDTALQLIDLALGQVPSGRRFYGLSSLLTARRAEDGLSHLGPSRLPEVRDGLAWAFDLYGQSSKEDNIAVSAMGHRVMDVSEYELAPCAASAYLTLAEHDPSLAAEAEKYTLQQLTSLPEGQGRSKMFGHLRLAKIRFLAGEAEQACDDGEQAVHLAPSVTSARIQARLRELLTASKPYADVPRVAEFRDRLRTSIGRMN
jgi:transcriptional regulator with XRE-family HTH domain